VQRYLKRFSSNAQVFLNEICTTFWYAIRQPQTEEYHFARVTYTMGNDDQTATVTPPSAASPAPAQQPVKRHRLRRILLIGGGVIAVLFIAIQLIPVNRTNPPVTAQLNWDSPQTQALFEQACQDCHSNETTWPWYSYVAPASWLVYYDVQRGRSELNLSTYDTDSAEPRRNPFGQSNDLAYQLGQILAGGNLRGGPEGRFPEGGRFPQGGQPPTVGQPPANGQFLPGGQFPPGGFGGMLANRLAENLQENRMPPANYLALHPTANLTTEERQQLLTGLMATLGLSNTQ
jgi:hypothetical protein